MRRLSDYKLSRDNLNNGVSNIIPFSKTFPKLSTFVPGLIKGKIYAITGATGSAKTKFTKCLCVLNSYDYAMSNIATGVDVKIIYFALEESKEEFHDSLVCTMLKRDYGLSISPNELNGYTKAIPDAILKKIKTVEDKLQDLYKYLTIENISNPFGMYKLCRKISRDRGEHYFVGLTDESLKHLTYDEYDKLKREDKDVYKYSHYTPHNPKEHVIVITDHLNLLASEKGAPTLSEAMTKWCTTYCKKQMTKHWNWTCVHVHQQYMSGDAKQFTSGGASIVEKLYPSLDKLGDNKLVARDYYVTIGLFNPYRYLMDKDLGYDISKLKNKYRTLIVLKNRLGDEGVRLGLKFYGASDNFEELPKATDVAQMKTIYHNL